MATVLFPKGESVPVNENLYTSTLKMSGLELLMVDNNQQVVATT